MVVGYSLGNKSENDDDIKVLGEDDPNVITYSKAKPLILSRMCRNSCPYCGFHRKDNLVVPYSTIRLSKDARAMGAREVVLEAGERPDKFPHIRATLDLWGFHSYLDYLYTIAELAFLEGLIPVMEVGFLSPPEIKSLSEICALMKMMLDSVDDHLYPEIYAKSPGKKLDLRIKNLQWAGKLGFPVVTGILVGIGESKEHRRDALSMIAELHKQYGHVHEVLIQNFVPLPNTPLASKEPPSRKTMLETVEMAREIIPADVSIIVPVEVNSDIRDFVKAGIRDFGRIMVSPHWLNQGAASSPPASIETLEKQVNELGFQLQQRFPLRKEFIQEGRYSKKLGQVFDNYRYKIKKETQEKQKETKTVGNGT